MLMDQFTMIKFSPLVENEKRLGWSYDFAKNIKKICKLMMLEKADDIENMMLEMFLMKGNCPVNILTMSMMYYH